MLLPSAGEEAGRLPAGATPERELRIGQRLGPLGSGQEIIRQSAIIPLPPVASAIEGGGGGGATMKRVLLENDL